MESAFKIWEANRKLYLNYLQNFTLKQLNEIPQNFNNNLIWNIGHIISVQQSIIYKSSGLDGYITNEFFDNYKPGTFPTGKTNQIEVDELKFNLTSLIKFMKIDYSNNLFSDFKPFNIGNIFMLNTIEDAILFNNYHEAMHIGNMIAISKFIGD